MKKIIYILLSYCLAISLSSAATSYEGGALDFYGYKSLLLTEAYSENNSGDIDEDKTFRKRRHRRRRKIRPPKKGW